MDRFLWLGVAGALGTWTRYLIGLGALRLFGAGFPLGTLIANLLGCFLIGAVAAAAISPILSPSLRLILATGFLGGLTTYSSFNQETLALLESRSFGLVALNLLGTLGGGLIAGTLGFGLGRRLFGS